MGATVPDNGWYFLKGMLYFPAWLVLSWSICGLLFHSNGNFCRLLLTNLCKLFDILMVFLDFNKPYILKTKSSFTLLIYIPFLVIGEWYFKCV